MIALFNKLQVSLMRETRNKFTNIRQQNKYLLEQRGYMFRPFILVINQLDAQIFFLFYNKFISCLYMFRPFILVINQLDAQMFFVLQ